MSDGKIYAFPDQLDTFLRAAPSPSVVGNVLWKLFERDEVELDAIENGYYQMLVTAYLGVEKAAASKKKHAEAVRLWREKKESQSNHCDGNVNGGGDATVKGLCDTPNQTTPNQTTPNQTTPNQSNTNHSIPIPLAKPGNGNGNGNGTELKKKIHDAVTAVRADASAIFDPTHTFPVLCAATVGDSKSARRWTQLEKAKGEDAVREELFAFVREIQSGEEPDNRGAALNARLAALPDKKGE